ncbi:MAG: ATP-binding cassette domain-containing protein [Anaerolineales bacterium]|jgi:ABC-2 type transport system ATP-binding protein|nr:ATP-binding cassette domain-containing protein [Anaerolineales bacterium]
MYAVAVDNLSKSFGSTRAVEDVSFAVQQGEIFGLLGPNGAGKTTTIRMVLDIFKPDRGMVSILDGPMSEAKKKRIGYMPEERGLYQDIPLERCLLYLAALKGVPEREARHRLAQHLERFDLAIHKNKKVKELSKGMQQKAQIISTILHQPELIVIDEPFTALDPVNVQLVKELIRELHQQGTTIVMSTHQMHLVEELCERILLINQGCDVLNGRLGEIQQRFAGHAVSVRVQGELPALQGVREVLPHNNAVKLMLEDQATPQDIFQALAASGVLVDRFEIAIPSLDEIFIRVVAEGGKHE